MRDRHNIFSHASRRLALSLMLTALAALAIAGCSTDQTTTSGAPASRSLAARITAPAPSQASPWFDLGKRRAHLPYPLAVGNRWDYLVNAQAVIVDNQGAQPPEVVQYPWTLLITDVTHLNQRLYYVQTEFDPSAGGPGPTGMFFERQDRTGLFELDASPIMLSARGGSAAPERLSPLASRLVARFESMPAAAAHRDAWRRAALALGRKLDGALHPIAVASAAGVPIPPPPGEIATLRYPLFVGASWILRENPHFDRHVAARERLSVPSGDYASWRIEEGSELFGPNDRVTFWYGDPGLLRILVHAEAPATDASGNIVGTAIFDSDQVLTTTDLKGASLMHTAAGEAGDAD